MIAYSVFELPIRCRWPITIIRHPAKRRLVEKEGGRETFNCCQNLSTSHKGNNQYPAFYSVFKDCLNLSSNVSLFFRWPSASLCKNTLLVNNVTPRSYELSFRHDPRIQWAGNINTQNGNVKRSIMADNRNNRASCFSRSIFIFKSRQFPVLLHQ